MSDYSFATVVCALEGVEQARRYSSQVRELQAQLATVLDLLDQTLDAMVVSGGKEGT